MNKKRILISICLIVVVLLSGCWNRREPKTLAIVDSIIYDITDDGMYHLTAEIMNPSAIGGVKVSGSSSGKSPSITVIGEALSAPEAIRNMSASLERSIFGGHNEVRFFSERLARKDIASIIDYFVRDPLTNEAPWMVVIKGENPERIYTCMLGLSDMVGEFIESLSKTQLETTSRSVFASTLDFIRDYYNDGKQPVMGVVELVECETKPSGNVQTGTQDGAQGSSEKRYKIVYEGLAAFKDNKLVGYLDGIGTRAYNFVTNNITAAYVTIPSGEDVTVVEIRNSNAAIKTSFDNGRAVIDVKVSASLHIIQESGLMDITKEGPLQAVEQGFNQLLVGEIAAAVQKAQQEFQSDIFGFGLSMHIQHPEIWKEIKGNWDDYFSNAIINISVESTVDRSGEIKQPFKVED
jgi:spore germination protein KC